jgi:enterochelin esterase-like enzyme
VHGEVATDERPIAIIVYLPPCYDEQADQRYPVLYLLNGQPFSRDPYPPGEQWIRIGAAEAADALIHSREAEPFIIVFPEDRYWNILQGARFGQYFLADVIPHIDANFRTLADREHRSLGGLSRGGGWAFQIGLTRPELFGSLGLHSPAILSSDRVAFERWMRELPSDLWPRLYLDVGDNDLERDFNIHIEELLTYYAVPHEWRLNNGAHDEAYWSAHVDEYIRWYAEGWALP